jgi:hypothetical protein
VDEGLHVFLHGSAGRGSDLVVFDLYGAGGHLVEALVDDAEGLAEFLHTAEVAVVAVTVYTDRNVEFNLVVGIVGLRLADVPGDTGTAQHDTSEAIVESIGGRDDTDTFGTSDPDTVVGQHLFGLVDAVAELGCPLVNIVEQTKRNVLADTTRADVGSVKTGSGDTFVEFLVLSVSFWKHSR